MKDRFASYRLMRRNSGQTLVIALIVMGVLLILGFVFLGFIDQNLVNTRSSQKESVASQIAEAGVRYAQQELLNSPQGADWRPPQTVMSPAPGSPNSTRDPDALYLRPGSGLAFNPSDPTQVDLGGPDGLGFYTRVNFQNGRALIRVRYAPSDANIFSSSPTGAIRNPGAARSYIIVEAVGRPGNINPNDPTTGGAGPLAQISGFGSPADVQTAIAAMKAAEVNFNTSRKLVAFASIGMLESGLYVTNKDRTTRPADIGFSFESGANYLGNAVTVPQVFGGLEPVYNLGAPPTPGGSASLGGSIYSNADLLIHGAVSLNLNQTLGDVVASNGTITAASNTSGINLFSSAYSKVAGNWTTSSTTITAAQLNTPASYSTHGGLIRDGYDGTDAAGYSRGIGYKAPPLIDNSDAENGENRYMLLTRDTGSRMGSGNSGMYGFGRGVYVNNTADNQLPATANGAAAAGGGQSLVYDWLNPDNGNSYSSWRGPYYVPPGAYLLLQSDGFTITKDQGVWTNPDGSATANPQASLRFRLGLGSDGAVHIVNALTPGIGDINGTGLNFNLGPQFNGVLYFAGNVRVRGVIPTDCQVTVVSGGTIYIEGSIIKGVVGSDVAVDVPRGRLLTRPTKSSCMLMAAQYVTLNTTQFFGPTTSGYAVDTAGGANDSVAPAVLQTTGDTLNLYHEFLLQNQPSATNPGVNPYNPSTWVPYDSTYADGTGKLETNLLLRESMDPTSGAAAYASLSINASLATPKYLFSLLPGSFNAAADVLGTGYVEPGYSTAGYASVYGLGDNAWQRYGHFETTTIPLVDSSFAYNAANQTLTSPNTNPNGTYTIGLNDVNVFQLGINALGTSPTSAYYLSRAAVVPADVRIEASMYAENGSWFVIPGPWFNPDPNDTRQAYLADATAKGSTAAADADRLENFGSTPATPFYGEPIDCRVLIYGSVSENMPAPESMQADWMKKWGWVPIAQGASGRSIPLDHQQGSVSNLYAPNMQIIYDPTLATGRVSGFVPNNGPGTNDPYLRTDPYGRPLAPFPCLPVSPTLEYFGDEQF